MFASTSHFQINGGNFMEIRGDVNLHTTQPAMRPESDPMAALQMGLCDGPGRLLSRVERNGRKAGATRIVPYNGLRGSELPDRRHDSAKHYPDYIPPTVPHQFSQNGYASKDIPDGTGQFNPQSFEHPSANNPLGARRGPGSLRHSPRGRANQSDSGIAFNHPSHPLHYCQDSARTSINIGGDMNHVERHGEQGLHILQRAAASDAFHDSAERYPQPKCHTDTRTEMLQDLLKWSSSTDSNSSVLWLHGPAGAGKSAIMQSLCQRLEMEARLGASFFFKRGHPSRGHSRKLFPTIAYQLALLPELNRIISRVVEENPSILDRSLSTQLQKLIFEPCRQSSHRRTFVIVVDGLDECDGLEIQQEILRSIGSVMREPHPFRFLVASRPEPHIREILVDALESIHRPVNINQSFEDVRMHLTDEFARIHQAHRSTMAMVPRPWPSLEIIDKLVVKSSGYFIYASTVIKFIDDKNYRPTERLQVITTGVKDSHFGSPFAALDELYTQILCAVPDQRRLLTILAVIAAKLDLPFGYTDELLGLDPGDVQLALRGLQSLISVGEERDLFGRSQIMVHHASFYDFLQDHTRAGKFYVGSGPHLMDVCSHIFKAFSYTYDDPVLNRRGHVSR
ncbi:NACHT domain-containing protein [Mycena venus]|uniref:NACHT domain-containing protein n=1 Tax=Mycena venus TaxID=2733690 RepID=A0A8H6Z3F6_9AGAR|nr:NACHT domain-containing protein [Mycena venus]